MAGIVTASDGSSYSFENAEYALAAEGHLYVHGQGDGGPEGILAVFAPGSWKQFIRQDAANHTKSAARRGLMN